MARNLHIYGTNSKGTEGLAKLSALVEKCINYYIEDIIEDGNRITRILTKKEKKEHIQKSC